MPTPVIAIFDIGKTNKKFFLLDEDYAVRWEKSIQLKELQDPDGFPCDDVMTLSQWMLDTFSEAFDLTDYEIRALNFSGYGASWVHLGQDENPIAPLYNYLKPYPVHLKQQFYGRYGGEARLATETASPILGNLNSGIQLYWLKYDRPEAFERIQVSLHLPQYLSYLFTRVPVSELTSIGCHTHLWNFETHEYHRWVQEEGMMEKFPPITGSNATQTIRYRSSKLLVGPGLHDSSAALIPYLATTKEPFVLISTGTWSISLNPFNDSTLTLEELREDCLCYISFQGKSVKSSRLFAGHEHDAVTRELSTHFKKPLDYFQTISTAPTNPLPPWTRPEDFPSYESAYGSFMNYLVQQQVRSTQLVLHHSDVKSIFVDGGFSSNFLFMTNLAKAFPDKAVYTTSLHQASTVGAAMAIHDSWNKKPIASSVLSLIRITA